MDIDVMIGENRNIVWQVINDLQYIPEGVEQDDVFQVGLISLWGAITSYVENDEYCLSTHCFTNVRGDILNYLDSQQRANRVGSEIESGVVPSFEDEVIENMLYGEIYKLLDKEEYELFYQFYIDKLDQADMAIINNISDRTIRRRLSLIRDKLRTTLKWEV